MGTDATCVDACAVGPLSVHRYRRVCIWLNRGSLIFGEGADAVPEGSARDARGTSAVLEAVVFSFGSPRWWRRWILFHGVGGADMAADAAVYTLVPLCGGGLSEGPRYGTASWGGV